MLDEGLLDDTERLLAADRSGDLRAAAGAGAQVRQGVTLAGEAGVDRLGRLDRPRAVLVLGSGPGALAGDLLAALTSTGGPAPVLVLRDPEALPLWVGVADLVLAVSHPGTEAGLLSCLDDAARRGASVLGIGPADTPMQEVCARTRASFLPASAEWPSHAALWSLVTPLVLAAHVTGLPGVGRAELEATADALDTVAERCRPGSDPVVNPAKALALELAGALPVVWGTSALGAVAARRFAGQLARCAGMLTGWGLLPGVAAEFGGLLDAVPDVGADLFADRVSDPAPARTRLLLLRDPVESEVAADRARWAGRSAEERGLGVTELRPDGAEPVRRFASLVALGDFASIYLGLATGWAG
ncbi:MAG TPA: SIS domain-containing protein [Mycobacteriales bacterium]|nr:SIS domain-containing protein [Mycobacteriales bacterium]